MAELRMRLRDEDFKRLKEKARGLELLPSVYGRSLMLRKMREDEQVPCTGKGSA